jgi:Protein of unknown function (DUF998)
MDAQYFGMGDIRSTAPQRRALVRSHDTGLWWAGVGGLALFVAVVLAEHALRPSLDPMRHQISEYANGETGGLMVAGFVFWAASLGATALLLARTRVGVALPLLIVGAAVGLLVAATWATQTSAGELPAGVHRGTAGRLHDLGAGVASLALLAGAVVSYRRIADRSLRCTVLLLLAVALLLDGVLLAVGPDVGGLRQRLLVAAGCGWQLVVLVACRRQGWRHQGHQDGTSA